MGSIMNKKTIILSLITSLALLTLVGCGSSSETETTGDTTIDDTTVLALDITKFDSSALKNYQEVDCTLTNGETTTCYEITISGFPSDRDDVGPFCPTTTYTDAESAGEWFNDGVLYDLTGEFVKNLAVFYGDSNWKLYDEAEEIKITTSYPAFNHKDYN